MSESAIKPEGFISKKYPDCRSRNVSITHMKRSSALKNSSRFIVLPSNWSGSESKQRTPM